MFFILFLGCSDPISKETQEKIGEKILDQEINYAEIQRDCFKTLYLYEPDTTIWRHIKFDFYENKKDQKIYYLTCSISGEHFAELEYKIDFKTYKDVGIYSYDKDSVYYNYMTSDKELLLKLDTADRKTFKPLGSFYAKDKNFVYCRGEIIKEADKTTFQVLNHPKCVCAKDKNHLYFWNEVIRDSGHIETLELEKYWKK